MKHYPPTSPARRQFGVINWKDAVTKERPFKPLVSGWKRDVGRNADGRITTRHKGGGSKRLWREIDFIYNKKDVPMHVLSLEYDPNRTSFIALVCFSDGEKRYVLAPQNLAVGGRIIVSEQAPLEIGNRLPLVKIPVGTIVYNVELTLGKGAQLARSAGTGAVVLAQEGNFTHLELPSKEVRMVRSENWASIGALSNAEHNLMTIGKAGRNRHKGVRPSVRGSVMNPCDHPHGGGEGRTQIGRRRGPATPWGKPARGVKTRNKRKRSSQYILSPRKK